MRKLMVTALALTIALLATALPAAADHGWHGGGGHGHGHVDFGVVIGGPGWWGGGWGYPYPYYPYYPYPYYPQQPVVVQETPEIYVQPAPAKPAEPQYWYFCRDPQGYYPDVKKCPKGWLKVVPPAKPAGEGE